MHFGKLAGLGFVLGLAAAAAAETPPRWAIGVFSGYNGFIKRDIQVEIRSDGQARFSSREAGNEIRRVIGSYSRSSLRFGRTEYAIEQWANGIRLTNWDNRDDWAQIRPGRAKWDQDNLDQNRPNQLVAEPPPSWAVGIFRDRKNGGRLEFRVSPRGQVYRIDGRANDQGVYQDRKFYIDGLSYTVNRLGNGLLLRVDQHRGETVSLVKVADWKWSTDPGNWTGPGTDRPTWVLPEAAWRPKLDVTAPRQNQVFRTREVWLRGRTNGEQVQIELYRTGIRIVSQTTKVTGGTFNNRFILLDGTYTARLRPVSDGRPGNEQSVTFRVDR